MTKCNARNIILVTRHNIFDYVVYISSVCTPSINGRFTSNPSLASLPAGDYEINRAFLENSCQCDAQIEEAVALLLRASENGIYVLFIVCLIMHYA